MDAKFNSIDFDIGAVSFQWFFALFVTSLPAHFALRIWDAFLLQGRDVLFFYALGILKVHCSAKVAVCCELARSGCGCNYGGDCGGGGVVGGCRSVGGAGTALYRGLSDVTGLLT